MDVKNWQIHHCEARAMTRQLNRSSKNSANLVFFFHKLLPSKHLEEAWIQEFASFFLPPFRLKRQSNVNNYSIILSILPLLASSHHCAERRLL